MSELDNFVWPSDFNRAEYEELNYVCEALEIAMDEIDALRAENERLKNEIRQKELIHLGYTNGAQISYIKEESGNIYPDTKNECCIPVYMLKIHEHRRLNDLKKFGVGEKTARD